MCGNHGWGWGWLSWTTVWVGWNGIYWLRLTPQHIIWHSSLINLRCTWAAPTYQYNTSLQHCPIKCMDSIIIIHAEDADLWHNISASLGTKPFTGGGKSGHSLTFAQDGMLTWPIRIINCKWCHENVFSPVLPTTRYGESLCCSRFYLSTWGEQRADWQWMYAWCHHGSLISHA